MASSTKGAKSGSLLVQTGLFKRWTRRWFIIEDKALVQYTNSKLTKLIRRYDLTDREAAAVAPKEPPRKKYCIRLAKPPPANPRKARQYNYFVAPNEAEQNAWIDAIAAAKGEKDTVRDEDRVFGVNLGELKKNANAFDAERGLPVIVIKCAEFLSQGERTSEEGIFRLGGNFERIQELRLQFDMGKNPTFEAEEDTHVVAGLLKLFLRSLPQPLLLADNYDALLSVCREEDRKLPAKLADVIGDLPVENCALLQYLVRFLVKVSQSGDKSKMDAKNLATVFGPNLLRHTDEDPMKMMAESDLVTRITLCILQNCESLFDFNAEAGAAEAAVKTAQPSPAPAPEPVQTEPTKTAPPPAIEVTPANDNDDDDKAGETGGDGADANEDPEPSESAVADSAERTESDE